ncbi:unnamed protein product [Euphydryas editha]|uniref:G-protein coupled receptors family 2 profile 2 domain-containing protein n=1 Tax=Euphydryas editha TaxID=104508 RepID=A0AAU9U801_EUPED|nr:unnamed protein product [Euphydryas editha]
MVTTTVSILIIFLFIVTFDFGYSTLSPKITVLDKTDINQTACETKKCIRKCCPKGQYLSKKNRCYKFTENVDFENTSVYDDNDPSLKINKTLSDLFLLVPGKFLEFIKECNKTFRQASGNLPYPTHLTKSGQLYLRLINSFQQWHLIDHFCIDYVIGSKEIVYYSVFVATCTGVTPTKSKMYYTVAALISSVFLFIVLVVYILLPELRNLPGMILMAYILSLISAFTSMASLQLSNKDFCVTSTAVIYFSFLASFCWMNVMSFDIWWTFRVFAKTSPIHKRGKTRTFALYCLYSWGVPLLMTIGLVILTQVDMSRIPWFITPQIPQQSCFLEGGQKLLYLYIPMLILIICNWLFFLMTVFNIWRLHHSTSMLNKPSTGSRVSHRKQWNRFMVYLKLSVVMGINWVLEIASFLTPDLKIWIIADFYNLLIGLTIFFIFVCKKKIFRKLQHRFCGYFNSTPRFTENNSSLSTSNSSQNIESQVFYHPTGIDE